MIQWRPSGDHAVWIMDPAAHVLPTLLAICAASRVPLDIPGRRRAEPRHPGPSIAIPVQGVAQAEGCGESLRLV